jgi:hypothetical protein
LAVSGFSSVNASVSSNLPVRSLVASDRFSVVTSVPISFSGSDPIISSTQSFSLVDSNLSDNRFLPAASRTSLPLVIAPSCAAVSSFSLADPPSADMALEISVIEESRAPDVACSSLLDVTAKPHSQGRFLGELTFGLQ